MRPRRVPDAGATTGSMFLEQCTSYFAEEFGRDADIPCDLVLRYPLGDERIFFEELFITFFRGLGNGGVESLLQDAERSLDQQPEHPFECGYLFEQLAFAGIV